MPGGKYQSTTAAKRSIRYMLLECFLEIRFRPTRLKTTYNEIMKPQRNDMQKLHRMRWDNALSTGDKGLDDQHKMLIDTFNELADVIEDGSSKDKIGKIISMLKFYANWHFLREEDCMEKYHCPVAGKNKKAHAVFLKNLERYEKEFEKLDRVMDLAMEMHTDLADWIYNHILALDSKLYHSIHPTTDPH